MDCNLELCTKIKHFFTKLLFVGVFYQSNRNETRTHGFTVSAYPTEQAVLTNREVMGSCLYYKRENLSLN